MSQAIRELFREIDASWRWVAPNKIQLRLIGSAALMLQTSYRRGTIDSDVLETVAITQELRARLLEIAGPNSKIYERRRMYIDVVSNGFPFLPQKLTCHPIHLGLQHFDLEVLDVVDVVVSKLKRFSPNDIRDIEAMVDLDLVPHASLVERFLAAVDFNDDRRDDMPRYLENLHKVERDILNVAESAIDHPYLSDD